MRSRSIPTARALLAILAIVLAACGGPVLANPPAARPAQTPPPSLVPLPPDPRPVELPRDDGPHDRLTEWWYYTGHLRAGDGPRFGFEYVVFRAERGGFPVTWASHLALTDETGGRFHYAQRAEIGPGVDRSPRDAGGDPTGFAFAVTGFGSGGSDAPAGGPMDHGREQRIRRIDRGGLGRRGVRRPGDRVRAGPAAPRNQAACAP